MRCRVSGESRRRLKENKREVSVEVLLMGSQNTAYNSTGKKLKETVK